MDRGAAELWVQAQAEAKYRWDVLEEVRRQEAADDERAGGAPAEKLIFQIAAVGWEQMPNVVSAEQIRRRWNYVPEGADGSFRGKMIIKTGHPAKPSMEVRFSGVCRAGVGGGR